MTLSAADAGSILPTGDVEVAIGQKLSIAVAAAETGIDWEPTLLIDGEPVELTEDGDVWTYELTVTGAHRVEASFTDLADNAVLVDAESWSLLRTIAPDYSSIEFGGSTALLAGLDVGDVISPPASANPAQSLIVRITGTYTPAGGGIGFTTEKASLFDIYANISYASLIPLEEEPVMAPLALMASEPLEVFDAPTLGSIDLGLAASLSGDCGSIDCSVSIQGNAHFQLPYLDFAIEVRWFSLEKFRAMMRTGYGFELEMDATAGPSWSFEKDLGSVQLARLNAVIGLVPITIAPIVEAEIGGSVSLTTGLRVDASAAAEVGVGPALENGEWSFAEFEGAIDGDIEFPGESLTAEAEVYFEIEPAVEIQFVCNAGTEFQVPPLEFEADPGETVDPWWGLEGSIKLDEVSLECVGIDLAALNIQAIIAGPYTLLEADGPFSMPPPPATCVVPNMIGLKVTQAQAAWTAAGFQAGNFSAKRPPNNDYNVAGQSLTPGLEHPCTSTSILVSNGALPGPTFTWNPTAPVALEDVSFDGPSGSILYSWDFNNDGVTDSTIEDPIVRFSASGTYLVSLTTDGGSTTHPVEVGAPVDFVLFSENFDADNTPAGWSNLATSLLEDGAARTSDNVTALSPEIAVTPGQWLELNVDTKDNSGSATDYIGLCFRATSGETVDVAADCIRVVTVAGGGYIAQIAAAVVPDGANFAMVYFSGNQHYDNVMVKVGTAPPAQGDIMIATFDDANRDDVFGWFWQSWSYSGGNGPDGGTDGSVTADALAPGDFAASPIYPVVTGRTIEWSIWACSDSGGGTSFGLYWMTNSIPGASVMNAESLDNCTNWSEQTGTATVPTGVNGLRLNAIWSPRIGNITVRYQE